MNPKTPTPMDIAALATIRSSCAGSVGHPDRGPRRDAALARLRHVFEAALPQRPGTDSPSTRP